MATATTPVTSATRSNEYQRYFSKKLLDHAIQALMLNQFATKAELPTQQGVKTARFFRRVEADKANVQTLTEGVAPTNFTQVTQQAVDVDLVQLGEVIKITDISTQTGLFSALKQGIDLMGEDCALKADDVTLNAIIAGGTLKRYGQKAANFNALVAATAANGCLKAADLLAAMTDLQIKRAPKVNGSYVAIVCPQVGYDLMRDEDWLEAAKYSSVQQLFKGEIGSLYGVRVVIATNPWTEASTAGTEGTRDAAGPIFSTIVTGSGGYGVVNLSGQSPMSPKVMIADKPEKVDPLNQYVTAGWKAYYQSLVLNPNWVEVIRSKTQYA